VLQQASSRLAHPRPKPPGRSALLGVAKGPQDQTPSPAYAGSTRHSSLVTHHRVQALSPFAFRLQAGAAALSTQHSELRARRISLAVSVSGFRAGHWGWGTVLFLGKRGLPPIHQGGEVNRLVGCYDQPGVGPRQHIDPLDEEPDNRAIQTLRKPFLQQSGTDWDDPLCF